MKGVGGTVLTTRSIAHGRVDHGKLLSLSDGLLQCQEKTTIFAYLPTLGKALGVGKLYTEFAQL